MINCKTLCWDCKNASCKCSWHDNFTPVDGWEAKKVYIKADKAETYLVINCPNFEPEKQKNEPMSEDKILSIRLGVSMRTIKRWKQFNELDKKIKKYETKLNKNI